MATRREIFQKIFNAAREVYCSGTEGFDDGEARQIAEMILEARGITRNMLLVEPMAETEVTDLEAIIEDIYQWRPVQHIIGTAEFAGMQLKVNSDVLIPRPETEELVEWIASESTPNSHILDVCTGSGCIAIALHRAIKESHVSAIDISREALAIARENAQRYAPKVRFMEGDALSPFAAMFDEQFDVIVSNPPYIPEKDRALMRPNVTRHEPSLALFVADNDPLIFYRAIARQAHHLLTKEGKLYFEIYELLVDDMVAMLRAEGYHNIEVKDDFRGKPRMICARPSSTTR